MSKLIYIDELRIKQELALREIALENFPWDEVENMIQPFLQPLYAHFRDQPAQLLEFLYQLVYESYIKGIMSSNKDIYESLSSKKMDEIINSVLNKFVFIKPTTEVANDKIKLHLHEIVKYWFTDGAKTKIKI